MNPERVFSLGKRGGGVRETGGRYEGTGPNLDDPSD